MDGFVLLLAIAIAVIVAVHENNKRNASPIYQEWLRYYLDNGFSTSDAKRYARVQDSRGVSLANYIGSTEGKPGAGVVQQQNISRPTLSPKEKKLRQLNGILIAATLLLVLGFFAMVQSIDDSLVAPFYLLLLFALYGTGLAIYKKVDYLKPVGHCFMTSTLFLAPILYISFKDIFHGATDISLFLTALITTITYIATAMIFNSKLIGGLAYAAATVLTISCIPAEFIHDSELYFYIASLVAYIVPAIATYFWLSRSKWLPMAFRKGAYIFATIIPLVIFSLNVMTRGFNDADSLYGYRIVNVLIPLIMLIAGVCFSGERVYKIMLRYGIQALLMAAFLDITRHDVFGFQGKLGNNLAIAFSILCAVLCCVQILISFFAKCENKDDEKQENISSVFSMVGMMASPLLSASVDNSNYVTATVLLAITILAAAYSIKKKNINYLYVSAASAFFFGIAAFDSNTLVAKSLSIAYYFALLAAGVVAAYGKRNFKKQDYNMHALLGVSITLLTLGSIGYIGSCSELDATSHALIQLAPIILALMASAWLSGNKAYKETAIYITALSICIIVNDSYYWVNESYMSSVGTGMLYAHATLFAFLATSLMNENYKERKNLIRLGLGYGFFTFITGTLAIEGTYGYDTNVEGFIFLAEQIAILAIAVIAQIKWLSISSGIAVTFATIYVTGLYQYTFVWFLVIAALLIAFVVWSLTAMHKKELAEGNKQSAVHAAAPQAAIAAPKEKSPAQDQQAPAVTTPKAETKVETKAESKTAPAMTESKPEIKLHDARLDTELEAPEIETDDGPVVPRD